MVCQKLKFKEEEKDRLSITMTNVKYLVVVVEDPTKIRRPPYFTAGDGDLRFLEVKFVHNRFLQR